MGAVCGHTHPPIHAGTQAARTDPPIEPCTNACTHPDHDAGLAPSQVHPDADLPLLGCQTPGRPLKVIGCHLRRAAQASRQEADRRGGHVSHVSKQKGTALHSPNTRAEAPAHRASCTPPWAGWWERPRQTSTPHLAAVGQAHGALGHKEQPSQVVAADRDAGWEALGLQAHVHTLHVLLLPPLLRGHGRAGDILLSILVLLLLLPLLPLLSPSISERRGRGRRPGRPPLHRRQQLHPPHPILLAQVHPLPLQGPPGRQDSETGCGNRSQESGGAQKWGSDPDGSRCARSGRCAHSNSLSAIGHPPSS